MWTLFSFTFMLKDFKKVSNKLESGQKNWNKRNTWSCTFFKTVWRRTCRYKLFYVFIKAFQGWVVLYFVFFILSNKSPFSDWAWNVHNLSFGSFCIAKNKIRKDETFIFSLDMAPLFFYMGTLHFVRAKLDTWWLEKHFATCLISHQQRKLD